MVKLKATGNQLGISHDGAHYDVEDGILEVPHHVVEVAAIHGFVRLTSEELRALEAESGPDTSPSDPLKTAREKMKRASTTKT